LNPSELTGGVRYFDALTNDARLVLDTLRSAARYKAMLGNYLKFESATSLGNHWQCEVRDALSGERHRVNARSIVNAAGPWAATFPQSKVKLRLTKGVHLVLDRARLPVNDAVVMTEGKRILFAIPWGERTILGTTDTDYSGPLDDVRTDFNDVRYLLQVVNRAFPEAKIEPFDILATWAGLRPLIASTSGSPSDISRAHEIRQSQPGWFDVAGGKLTTYRLIGEQVVDHIGKYLNLKTPPCGTAEELLESNYSGILPPPVSREVVEHFCTQEWAVHLQDVMVRRTSWHYYLRDPATTAEQVAVWMAEILGWDDNRRAEEIAQYQKQRHEDVVK
jgi:glycerol-3-phosphate dehydrogenase